MSAKRWWILNKKEIKRLYPTKSTIQSKVYELCHGEEIVMEPLRTVDDHVKYIFKHPSNIKSTSNEPAIGPIQSQSDNAPDTTVGLDSSEDDTTQTEAQHGSGIVEEQPSIFDIASKPQPANDIMDVLKKMNIVYGSDVLSLEAIRKISAAGYTVGLLCDTLQQSLASQKSFLAFIGESVDTGIVKVHMLVAYFSKHFKHSPEASCLPFDDILHLFQTIFNFILGEAEDEMEHKVLFAHVKRIWQRKQYVDVRKIKGKEKLSIGKVRNDAVDVLCREAYVVKISMIKGKPKQCRKDSQKEQDEKAIQLSDVEKDDSDKNKNKKCKKK
eukprot:232655_1